MLGAAGSGKTGCFLEEIRRRAAEGEGRQTLIVPDQYSHEAERELCRVCGDGISLHAEVLSFSRLCSRVLSETGGCPGTALDDGGRILVMHLALSSAAPVLQLFGAGIRGTDFLQSLLQTYDEFRAARIRPEALVEASARADGSLRRKLADLAAVFAAYDAAIPEGVYDPADRLDALADRIESSSFGSGGVVFVDGFADFTAQERAVLTALLRKGVHLKVTVPCPREEGLEPEFELPRRTLRRLRRMAEDQGARVEIRIQEEESGRASALQEYCKNLFLPVDETESDADGAIRLFSAAGKSEECELAASEILRLVRDGCRWREIAVVARGWERYGAEAVAVLEKYGIPVQTTDRRPVLDRPVLAFLTGLLDVIVDGWNYESVFRCLKTGFITRDPEELDQLENYILKWNIRGSKVWTRTEDWTRDPEGFGEGQDNREQLERINGLRRRFAVPVGRLEAALRREETARGKAEALWSCAAELGTDKAVEERAASLREAGDLQLSSEYLQLWEIFVTALEQLSGVLGETAVSVEDFSRLLEMVLSCYDVGTIPTALDRVACGDLLRTGRRHLKWLLVLGATDDSIPAVGRKTGILTEEERDEIALCGLDLDDTGEARLSREMYAVYAAFSLPSEGLSMFWPGRGGDVQPSPLAARAKKQFRITIREIEDGDRTLSPLPCFELAVGAELPGSSRESKAASAWFSSLPDWGARLDAVRAAAAHRRESLSADAAKKLYNARMNLTASRVDKFYACRFAYFLQYGLKVKPRRAAGMDAPEAGTFFHYLLEHVASWARERGGFAAVTDEECRAYTKQCVESYAREKMGGLRDQTERFRYLFLRLGREAERVVLDMAQELRRSDFLPMDFELEFADGSSGLPAVRLDGGDVDVRVRGCVDRVDGWVHNGRIYLRVVDYKTGQKSFSLSEVYYGMGMQMLIYLFALQKMGREKYGMEVVPAGVLYTPARDVIVSVEPGTPEEEILTEREKKLKRSGLLLADDEVLQAMDREGSGSLLPFRFKKDGTISGDSLARSEQFGILARHVRLLLLQMARELRRGSIEAEPFVKSEQDSACRFCDYASVCRFQEDRGDLPRHLRTLGRDEAFEKMEAEG